MCCRESKRICIIDYRIEHMENHMEDNDIPKFRTYRGEIEVVVAGKHFLRVIMVEILILFHLNSSFNDFKV